MEAVETLLKLVNSGDIFIDCGANVGQETIPLAQKGAQVYAFEPNEFAFQQLKKSTKDFPNVHLYNQAVWDRNTTMKLYSHENSDQDEVKWSTGSSMLAEKVNVLQDKFTEVEVIDIVEFVRSLNKQVKVLKIDVEGSEFEIIEKLINTKTYELVDYIFVETHEKKIASLRPKHAKVVQMIQDHNITNINLNWV